ncbi:unnamed protein product [Ilex paraguariensis]|uniref:CW-type domain-containing protein n=1 Tax=Ilex paraguariensis TaxID=185542 RepID=A0ABC8UD93_9AQUA
MISVGSRDGRKGIGLGIGVGKEMDETELEEGEASCYQNGDESIIDPDVALSYIDEKLQDVLGHFQKDFEGGVSAENLGAKFGGYGSFLPAYQRSPACFHPRTSPKDHIDNMPRSPNIVHLEGVRHNSVVSSNASVSATHGLASASSVLLPAVRVSSVKDLVNQDLCMSSAHCADVPISTCELMTNSANPSDQRTLKVRIKVGSDNLSTQKNAEIYSGLGLDVSPCSSLDGSPIGSHRFSHEHPNGPDESPTSILQIMTSFPVCGNQLVSPLPYDLMHFTDKGRILGDSRSLYMHKGSRESSVMFINNSDSASTDRKISGEKKLKSLGKNALAMEFNDGKGVDAPNSTGVLPKKETEIDTLDCEELVSNALKLPLLSNSFCKVADSGKGTASEDDISRVADKSRLMEKSFSDLAEEKPLDPVFTQEIGLVGKPNGKAGADGKIVLSKKANFQDDDSVYPRKEGNSKGEKIDISAKADTNRSKGRKAHYAELTDLQKQKAGQKAIFHQEDGMKLTPTKEQSSSGGKKKSKGILSHVAEGAELPKNDLKIGSSLTHKNWKSTTIMSRSEAEYLRKDQGKVRDRYKDFFGDLELEQGDNEMTLEEMPSSNRLKDSDVVEKSTFQFTSTSKEKLNVKKNDKPLTSEAYSKVAANVAPITENGPIPDAVPATGAPVLEEYWVCCDKCQKWRLLPLGRNPDSLPEKWLCSMLDWLPGMNRCIVSEEVTTKALTTLYPVSASASASESQICRQAHPGEVLSGADAQHFNQSHQNLCLDFVATEGKKKHGLKDVSNSTIQDGTTHCSNPMKKIPQATVKSRSLNGVNQSPPLNELDFQHFGQSNSLDRQRHKQKEKNKQLENYPDGGDPKNLKVRNKRETGKDCFEASKKIKTEGVHHKNEALTSDYGGDFLKGCCSSSSGLSIIASRKDWLKYNDSSKDSKCGADDNLQHLVRNPEDQIQMVSDDGLLPMGKYGGVDLLKKRKVNACQETQIYPGSLPIAGHHLQDSRDFTEGTSENDHREEKKARITKSEGLETSIGKGNARTDKKGRRMKNQHGPDLGITQSQQNLDTMYSFKRDLGSVRPSLAATSSSSKVSGSHKNQATLQEEKGSPVESVSSSPLRISNLDKFTSSRRDLDDKDDSHDVGFFAMASPRRCSDGENDGRNGSGIARKDESFTVSHHGSLGSSVLEFHGRDLGHASLSKAKSEILSSPEFATRHISDGDVDTFGQGTQYVCKLHTPDQCRDEEMGNANQYHANGFHSRKSAKDSLSRSKDKSRSFRSEFDKGNVKTSDSGNEYRDHIPHYEEKLKAGRNKFPEKFVVVSGKDEKPLVSRKDSAGRLLGESAKRENQSEFGWHADSDVRVDSISGQVLKQNMLMDHDSERSSKRFPADLTEQVEVSGRGKQHSLPPSGKGHIETLKRCPQPIPGPQKENAANTLSVDASEGDDALKAPKQIKKAENQNGNHPTNSRHPTPNGKKVRDLDAPSPLRRDTSSQAASNAVKEAKDLKHLADRLKNSGSNVESTGLYFQAVLKFLHGASLLESCNSESAKQGEMIQSIQMYSSTAKLCEFCAHEYEKSKDMAAAALAYKCMEVAYMRVIYSSHSTAGRDHHELQATLKTVPLGESPSSSASDVDNFNPATGDKVAVAKGVSSPQVTGNHVIPARNRSSYARLLNFTQDVNFAMEASRKALIAFAAANSRLEDAQYKEGITAVKKALDFNFLDVEGLLRLVRLAMEAVSH